MVCWKIPQSFDDFPIETFIYRGFPSDHRRVTENEPTYIMVDSWLLISHIIGLYQDTDF